jgi:hypothetical protein
MVALCLRLARLSASEKLFGNAEILETNALAKYVISVG